MVLYVPSRPSARIYRYTRTRVFNVEDLEAPTLVHVYDSSETACDHNQYITDDNVVRVAQVAVLD